MVKTIFITNYVKSDDFQKAQPPNVGQNQTHILFLKRHIKLQN